MLDELSASENDRRVARRGDSESRMASTALSTCDAALLPASEIALLEGVAALSESSSSSSEAEESMEWREPALLSDSGTRKPLGCREVRPMLALLPMLLALLPLVLLPFELALVFTSLRPRLPLELAPPEGADDADAADEADDGARSCSDGRVIAARADSARRRKAEAADWPTFGSGGAMGGGICLLDCACGCGCGCRCGCCCCCCWHLSCGCRCGWWRGCNHDVLVRSASAGPAADDEAVGGTDEEGAERMRADGAAWPARSAISGDNSSSLWRGCDLGGAFLSLVRMLTSRLISAEATSLNSALSGKIRLLVTACIVLWLYRFHTEPVYS